ncbi:MAG: GmrSD restriction endonuclease domain-containing protein [Candidatus Chromulinivorax sp.]
MKNAKETFRKFIGYLNNEEQDGGYWLPKIQRQFVWSEEQIEYLFDSIMREYPIGTLLVWKTKSKIRRRRFNDNYMVDMSIIASYVPENDKTKMLVLDGQQRLQSLYIGLKGSYEGTELCINILSGDLAAPDDIRYKFEFRENKDIAAPWFKFKDIVFSNEKYNRIAEDLIKEFPESINENQKERIQDNVSQIVKLFMTEENLAYQIVDSVDNPKLYTEEDIVEIFIRANAGGTLLGKSDLLFSLLTSSWDEADDNLEDLLDELNKTGYKFNRDFILKTCLTIFGKGAAYNVEKFRDTTTRESIINNWKEVSEAIKDVKDYIYGKTFVKTDATLPSYLVLIPLIYFRYHYKKEWPSTKRIQEYLLRTLLAGAYSGSPDSLIDKCVKKIDEQKAFDVNEIFGVIVSEGRNLEISKKTILETYYGSKAIHLLFNIWYDFNYQPSYYMNKPQVDHIFPQSRLKKLKVPNENTGKLNVMKYKWEDRDQIANCMLLTAEENGAGGKTDIIPEEWFADKSQEYLDLHLIPSNKELWKIENYEQFIEERKKLILKKFENIIIKTVTEGNDSIKMGTKNAFFTATEENQLIIYFEGKQKSQFLNVIILKALEKFSKGEKDKTWEILMDACEKAYDKSENMANNLPEKNKAITIANILYLTLTTPAF